MATTEFKRALLTASLEEFADVPSEEEIDLTFSEGFEKKVRLLAKKTEQVAPRSFGRTLRRTLLIAAILATLTVAAFATPAIREAFWELFSVSESGEHYLFSFTPEQQAAAPEAIEKVYKITYFPDGFYEYECHTDRSRRSFQQEIRSLPGSLGSITLLQNTIPLWQSFEAARQEEDMEVVSLGGYDVICIRGETTTLYWTDYEYVFHLYIQASLSWEECTEIFCSITLAEAVDLNE